MPGVVHSTILPELGCRLCPRLDLPEGTMLVVGPYDKQSAIFFDVVLRELEVGVDVIGIAIFEPSL
jgi:hypothetical protein